MYKLVRRVAGGVKRRVIKRVSRLVLINQIGISPDVGLTFRDSSVLARERRAYRKGEDSELLYLINKLIADADAALLRQPPSVVDKLKTPPSGDKRDYFSLAPYWWPDPATEKGFPFVRRDGEWFPDALLFTDGSDQYDRQRLYQMFSDSILVALAWYFTGKKKYARHGAAILERFFVNKHTRMNPNLSYAQVRLGLDDNNGAPYGIIEGEGMYYYLDAVKILRRAGVISGASLRAFRVWLVDYLDWLKESPNGVVERDTRNNHGTLYDLQVASIADFLGDSRVLAETFSRAKERINSHFAPDGSQPEELVRTNSAHYCTSNYQAWIYLSKLALKHGVNLWEHVSQYGGSPLGMGAAWILSFPLRRWPFQQINHFDSDRLVAVRWTVPERYIDRKIRDRFSKYTLYTRTPVFGPGYTPDPNPNNSIQPYWNLGL